MSKRFTLQACKCRHFGPKRLKLSGGADVSKPKRCYHFGPRYQKESNIGHRRVTSQVKL